jgi:hypothetical protein
MGTADLIVSISIHGRNVYQRKLTRRNRDFEEIIAIGFSEKAIRYSLV